MTDEIADPSTSFGANSAPNSAQDENFLSSELTTQETSPHQRERTGSLSMSNHQQSGPQQSGKMWSGRFREPLDAFFDQWQRSLRFDWQLLEQEVVASKAHALALRAAKILTESEAVAIRQGLDSVVGQFRDAKTGGAAWVRDNSDAEDIHHFVELQLSARIGDLALKLHTGRSRNEQIATDLRLYIRSSIEMLREHLFAWAEALLARAAAAEDAVMPAYTHLQRAEPVLVAHWMLAYVEMLLRDASRLQDCSDRLNYCPLGSGAVAGATLKLDRGIAARELAFSAPTANSMDATSDRDFVLEYLQVLTQIGLHASRFAEEITLYATAEFGFVELPEAFSTGSSAMPQKKNPDLTELVRAKVGRLHGAAEAVTLLLKGLPLAYNKDMQETQEPVFQATAVAHQMLHVLAPFTGALRFKTDRMRAACEVGFLNAMAAATYLVYKGVPFRKAHEKIGNAVRYCLDKGCELGDLSIEELKEFGVEFDTDFFTSVTLQATLDCHDVIGGTATQRVKEALVSTAKRIAELRGENATQSIQASAEVAHAGA
jgi:argininosuccinate lyase